MVCVVMGEFQTLGFPPEAWKKVKSYLRTIAKNREWKFDSIFQ